MSKPTFSAVSNNVTPDLEMTQAADLLANEDVLSFCAGPVNWTMPTTWPFVIDGLDLSEIGKLLKPVSDYLQVIFSAATTVTSPLYAVLSPVVGIVDSLLEATHLAYVPNMQKLLAMLTQFSGYANQPSLKLKMNSYVGLANVGTDIQVGETPLNIWRGVVGGPPYPVVMPRSGYITSFAADLNALAALNPHQILNIIPGLQEVLNVLPMVLNAVSGVTGSLSIILRPILNTLLAPFGLSINVPSVPDLSADMSTNDFLSPDTVLLNATLWRVPNIMSNDPNQVNKDATTDAFIGAPVEMQGVQGSSSAGTTALARICLGEIELAHVSAWDATTSLPGTALSALATVLGLNGVATDQTAAESGQFASALTVFPTPIPVNQGDSLMVEFSIDAPIGIAVAIAAPNLSANVTYA